MPLPRLLLPIALTCLASAAFAQSRPPTCVALDRLTAELNAVADTKRVQEIRSIYTIWGLSFGGTETEAKCQGAYADLTIIAEELPPPADERPEACLAVDGAISRIVDVIEERGLMNAPDLPDPDQVMADAGMRVFGVSPDGRDTIETCEAALPGLERIFIDLQARDAGKRGAFDQFSTADDAGIEGDTPGFGVWADRFRLRGVAEGSGLNMRRGPSTASPIIVEIPFWAEDVLAVLPGCTPQMDQWAYQDANRATREAMLDTRWCKVVWENQEGWVYGRYLRPM